MDGKGVWQFQDGAEFRFGEGVVDSGAHVRNKDQIQIGIGLLKRDMTCSPYIPDGLSGGGQEYQEAADGDQNQMVQAIGKEYTVWLQGKG